jgi:hypothetical protein
MKPVLAFALIVGFTAAVQASDNSIEVTLEITPADQQAQRNVLVPDASGWSLLQSAVADQQKPPPQKTNSDPNYGYWRNKFEGGSDKPLGTPKETAVIKALVPATMSPIIRWVSRSIVVVSADCRRPPPYVLAAGCLYVFEKHGSKWSLTHYYRWPFPHFF